MYCASCGTAITPGLSYCKRCGTGLSANERTGNKLSLQQIDSLVWAIVVVAVVGVGAPIGLISVMKQVLQLENGLILGAWLLSVLPFLAAEIVFIWLLLHSKNAGGEPARPKGATTRELEVARQRVLPEPSSSVIEHTTHTLDPIRRIETE